MKLKFFSKAFVDRLRNGAADNQPKYGLDPSWVDAFAGSVPVAFESRMVIDPPPQLRIEESDNASHDAENAVHIYTWLRQLSPALAMEERLWAYLAHSVFPAYMHARWPARSASAIHRRYLFEGQTFAALSRNGIARLWWAGHLTHDPKRSDPFELTRILFLRQDIEVALLERALGKCESVRTAVLEFVRDNEAWLSERNFGGLIQDLLLELNLLGGVAILDALPASEIHRHLDREAKRLAGSGAP